jgi:hypothetical protein
MGQYKARHASDELFIVRTFLWLPISCIKGQPVTPSVPALGGKTEDEDDRP